MKCLDCKFAQWKLTATGRKHPDGSGRCTWSKTFRISASTHHPGTYHKRGEPLTLSGSFIDRRNAITQCDVFEARK